MDERTGRNPFADIRLDWIVTPGDISWTIPGHFDGGGEAADNRCASGNIWRAHFVPPVVGEHNWKVEFHAGADMAIEPSPGERLDGNGATGRFTVSCQSANPVHARGLLQYGGESYYRYVGDNCIFFKFGPDAPENMRAYSGVPAEQYAAMKPRAQWRGAGSGSF